MISISESLTELSSLVKRDPKRAEERAAKEFEAMVLGEMMKAGNKPLMGESLLDGGSAGRMAREQLYAQLALEAARGGGLGLAEQLGASAEDTIEASEPRNDAKDRQA